MNPDIILNYIKRNLIQLVIGLTFFILTFIIIQPLFKAKQVIIGLDQTVVRTSNNRFAGKLGTLDQGKKVSVLSENNDWYRIRYGKQAIGWIPAWNTGRGFQKGQVASKLSESTIVIDPGHGGNDSGALAINPKNQEKVYTLRTSKVIEKHLEQAGAKVIMTRDKDVFVDLAPRPKMANDLKADAFISIHYDSAANNNDGTGDTTYYYHKNNGSLQLAKDVNQEIVKNVPLYNRGVDFGDYEVLRDNKRPAILIEGGYINTKKDFKELSSSDYPTKVANSVTSGLKTFLNR